MARTKTTGNTQNDTKTLTTPWRNSHLEKLYFCVFRIFLFFLFFFINNILNEFSKKSWAPLTNIFIALFSLSLFKCVQEYAKLRQYETVPLTPVRLKWRPYSVSTALKNADGRGARCGNASNAVGTLSNRLERRAAAFILSMLKTNAAAWRLHSVLDSTLWQRYGNAVYI